MMEARAQERTIVYMNEAGTIGVTFDPDGTATATTRESPNDMWGPPDALREIGVPGTNENQRLRNALERCYQTGKGPHVEIARRALDEE